MRDGGRVGGVGDAAELLHWLRRMVGRVDGVGRMRVQGAMTRPAGPPALPAPVPGPASPRDLAEAVFGRATAVSAPGPRTVVGRRGRTVRVEGRRARAAGQMERGL